MGNQAMFFLATSVVMSGMILLLIFLSKLFSKKLSAKLRYAVWIIVMGGLIIPFRPIVGNGLFQIEMAPSVSTQPANLQGSPAVDSTTDSMAEMKDAQDTDSASAPDLSFTLIFICIWGIVAILMMAVHIWRYFCFSKMIRRWGVAVDDEHILTLLQSVGSDIGLDTKKIDLKTSNFISSSMLTGFFRPVILLPERHFDEDELQIIFKHELIHYKRHDLFIKLLAVIATSMHWFNPIVYWANKVMQADGEAACDEAVVQDADMENRRFYSEVIIGMISTKNTIRTPLSTCFYGEKSGLKARLESIMDIREKKRKIAFVGIIPILAMILLSGSVIAFDNPVENTDIASVEYIYPVAKSITAKHWGKTTSANATENSFESTRITILKAKEIALVKVGGGTIKKYEVAYKNGRKVYKIIIIFENKEYEIEVDAINGIIINYSVEAIITSAKGTTNHSKKNNTSVRVNNNITRNSSGGSHKDDDSKEDDSDVSADEEDDSVDESETSVDESEASTDESETSADESEASTDESEASTDESEASTDESEASTDESEAPANENKTSADN